MLQLLLLVLLTELRPHWVRVDVHFAELSRYVGKVELREGDPETWPGREFDLLSVTCQGQTCHGTNRSSQVTTITTHFHLINVTT